MSERGCLHTTSNLPNLVAFKISFILDLSPSYNSIAMRFLRGFGLTSLGITVLNGCCFIPFPIATGEQQKDAAFFPMAVTSMVLPFL